MENERVVLATVGFILEPNTADPDYLQAMQDLLTATNGLSRPNDFFRPTGVVSIHHLGDEGVNAARCTNCGRWATNVDLPDRVDGVEAGSIVDGRFLCEQCRAYLARTRKDGP